MDSRGETVIDCVANLVSILEDAGEEAILRQLRLACMPWTRLRSV
jgi:hypothetical protein